MRFYVYALIDTRNGQPFYIGKGQNNRIAAHEVEAKKGKGSNEIKIMRIRDIWEAGFKVGRCILKVFDNEQLAYNYEQEVIAEIGLSNLTNLSSGGGSPRTESQESKDISTINLCMRWLAQPHLRGTGNIYDILLKQLRNESREVINRRGVDWAVDNGISPTLEYIANRGIISHAI